MHTKLLLAAEDGPWASDTVSYGYAYGRRQSMTVNQPVPAIWQEVDGFDAASRLTQVTSPAGQFDYTYAGPGSLVTNLALPGGAAITNLHDTVGRLTGTWLRTASGEILNSHEQERDANNLLRVTYTRGRDLSGARQGAGGIGGMLARTDNPLLASGDTAAHAYYHADGIGNITALVDASGAVVARYLYEPYGNVLAKAGPLADANLYRFSSKELHIASDLYYYGYRFYQPGNQRWHNRDPIGEAGGVNLFGFGKGSVLTNDNQVADRSSILDSQRPGHGHPASQPTLQVCPITRHCHLERGRPTY